MRKISLIALSVLALVACDKHDPILPGVRSAIFSENKLHVLNIDVTNLPDNITEQKVSECPYTQTSSNVIMRGDAKIFAGFPTQNTVACEHRPVCSGKYLYAGLTTGTVIKINPQNRAIIWTNDVYRASNLTGGTSVVDIVSPIVLNNGYVYAAGLGDAFCKINSDNGEKKWCIEIGSGHEFIVLKNVSYIVGTDNNLYAVRNSDGAIYWTTPVDTNTKPEYKDKTIIVGAQVFDATSGSTIK